MNILIGILVFVTLVTIFLTTYVLNKRTPAPEGTDFSEADCQGCKMQGCSNRSKFR